MPKTNPKIDVTQTRQEFIDEKSERERSATTRATEVARSMVIAMSSGSDFGVEDFIFAASLGEPEKYQQEADTLTRAAMITGGGLVALLDRDKVSVVGVAADDPFTMRVSTDMTDTVRIQRDRHMSAGLHFILASRSTANETRWPQTNTETYSEPVSVDLLRTAGEPDWDQRIFYRPKGIVIGTEAIIERVRETDDTIGARQLAECVELLGIVALKENDPAKFRKLHI